MLHIGRWAAVVAVTAERKPASVKRGDCRPLLALRDVEHSFNDQFIKELARTAKLPAGADIACFGDDIRIAVRIFLEAKNRLNSPKLREAVVNSTASIAAPSTAAIQQRKFLHARLLKCRLT